jgi:hypothetical protein
MAASGPRRRCSGGEAGGGQHGGPLVLQRHQLTDEAVDERAERLGPGRELAQPGLHVLLDHPPGAVPARRDQQFRIDVRPAAGDRGAQRFRAAGPVQRDVVPGRAAGPVQRDVVPGRAAGRTPAAPAWGPGRPARPVAWPPAPGAAPRPAVPRLVPRRPAPRPAVPRPVPPSRAPSRRSAPRPAVPRPVPPFRAPDRPTRPIRPSRPIYVVDSCFVVVYRYWDTCDRPPSTKQPRKLPHRGRGTRIAGRMGQHAVTALVAGAWQGRVRPVAVRALNLGP